MKVEKLKINETFVWLTLDQLKMYSEDLAVISTINKFLCYFSLSEPTIFHGELLIDENKKPIIFDSEHSAIEYAKTEILKRFKN